MAQVFLTGRTGNVAGLACALYSWEADLRCDALETSAFGGVFRSRIQGFQDANGQAVARLTRGTASDDPTVLYGNNPYNLTMIANTSPGCTLGFAAIISNIRFVDVFDQVAIVTFSYLSTGAITTQWDET